MADTRDPVAKTTMKEIAQQAGVALLLSFPGPERASGRE